MDALWLAAVGIFFLIAGLAALAYDAMRRRRGRSAYPFPDTATNVLDAADMERAIQQGSLSAPASAPAPVAASPWKFRGGRPGLKPRGPAILKRTPLSGRALGILAASLLALMAALALALNVLSDKRQAARVPGTLVVALCPYSGSRQPDATLVGDLRQQNALGATRITLVECSSPPENEKKAEDERRRIQADVLVWGFADAANATAHLSISPEFAPASPAWEKWSDSSPSLLVLPTNLLVPLPAASGSMPLEPVIDALSDLARGDFPAAANAASGAADTLHARGTPAQGPFMIQAIATQAEGDNAAAVALYNKAEELDELPAEALVDRARALIALSELPAAERDVDRALTLAGTPTRVQAAAHALRATIQRLSGDLTGSVVEADAALKQSPGSIEARYEKALSLYAAAQPDLARSELEGILQAQPDHAPARVSLALVWLMLGKPEEAGSALASAETLFTRWQGLLRAEEARAQLAGDTPTASAATRGIVALDRDLAGVHLYRAMALGDEARREAPESFFGRLWRIFRSQPTTYERAVSELETARRLDPHRLDVLLEMGTIYQATGDPEKAGNALKQAIDLSPAAPEPYLARASLQEAQGSSKDAVQTLSSLIERAPATFQAYQQLADLYAKEGDSKSATSTLERGAALPAQTPSDHLWKGKFLYALGKVSEAESELLQADQSLPEVHVLLGKIYEAQAQSTEALAEFEAALQRQPNEPTALLEAGKLFVLAGKPDDAEKLFSRLTTLVPGDTQGHIEYSRLLAGKGRLAEAVEQSRKAVQADPGSPDAHFALAQAFEAARDWPNAAAEYAETTKRDPEQFEAFIRLATVLYNDDRYNEALQAANEAIKLRPDDPQGYRWAAEAHLQQRDPNGALAAANEALKLSPEMPEALAVAARAYAARGDWASAEQYANASAAADRQKPAGNLARGDVLLAENRQEEALRAFQEAARLSSRLAEAITGEGRCYSSRGDQQKAIDAFRSALENDPGYAPAHLYMGHSFVARGRWDDALREYSQAVALRPNWPEALYYQGRALVEKKNLTGAVTAFSKATQESPYLVEAWYGLGIAQRGLNEDKDAIASLKKVTDLNPGYSDAWLYLGLVYEESGDRDAARAAFQEALGNAPSDATAAQAQQGLERVK